MIFKSCLGQHIWWLRNKHDLTRSDLAGVLQCSIEVILDLEENGDDPEDLLSRIIPLFNLDRDVIETKKQEDKLLRSIWLRSCAVVKSPYIVIIGRDLSEATYIPKEIVKLGSRAIEVYAKEFAKEWKQDVEVLLRAYIRMIITPEGKMTYVESGYFEPWRNRAIEVPDQE